MMCYLLNNNLFPPFSLASWVFAHLSQHILRCCRMHFEYCRAIWIHHEMHFKHPRVSVYVVVHCGASLEHCRWCPVYCTEYLHVTRCSCGVVRRSCRGTWVCLAGYSPVLYFVKSTHVFKWGAWSATPLCCLNTFSSKAFGCDTHLLVATILQHFLLFYWHVRHLLICPSLITGGVSTGLCLLALWNLWMCRPLLLPSSCSHI